MNLADGPISVCCHTCHTDAGLPCKSRRRPDNEAFCYTRLRHHEAQVKAGRYTCPVCIADIAVYEEKQR